MTTHINIKTKKKTLAKNLKIKKKKKKKTVSFAHQLTKPSLL